MSSATRTSTVQVTPLGGKRSGYPSPETYDAAPNSPPYVMGNTTQQGRPNAVKYASAKNLLDQLGNADFSHYAAQDHHSSPPEKRHSRVSASRDVTACSQPSNRQESHEDEDGDRDSYKNESEKESWLSKLSFLWSIRIVTATLCTMLIIVTAVSLLVTTFTFSMDAVEVIAERQAVSIATKGRDDVETLLNKPLASVAGWQYTLSRNNHSLPKDEEASGNPEWYYKYWDDFTAAMSSAHFGYQYAFFGYDDGNYATCKNAPNDRFQCLIYNWGSRPLNGSGTSKSLTRTYERADFNLVSETRGTTVYDPRTRGWYRMVEHKPFAMEWSSVFLSAVPTLPILSLNAAVYNASGVLLGVTSIAFGLSTLSAFLGDLITTDNTVAVLIDNQDLLLASSYSVPFLTSTDIPTTYAGTVPGNCLKSDSAGGATSSIMVCRASLTEYAYAPLRELAAVKPDLVKTGEQNTAHRIKLDGADFFVSVVPISTPLAKGMHWRFALFVPQSDIVGGIIRGRDIAIYISIAIVFAAVALCFVVLTFLMSPLQSVTESMYKLATLQDTHDAAAPSSLYEIAKIQSAFNVMSAELTKVKSFLPESVLAQLYGGRSDSEDEVIACSEAESDAAAMGVSDHSSINKRPRPFNGSVGSFKNDDTHGNSTPQSCRESSKESNNQAVAKIETRAHRDAARSRAAHNKQPQLNTSLSLTIRKVSIMCANIVNYHSHVIGTDASALLTLSSDIVHVVAMAVRDHKGVLDGFQGDKFVASFNAVTSVGNHAVAAAGAALAAAEAIRGLRTPNGKALRLLSGIASGPATVGNMGTQALMRYTVLGPVVTTAGLLERLCKRYPGVTALISGNAIVDIENFFELLTCDIVDLPAADNKTRRTRIAAVMDAKDSSMDEWMYSIDAAGRQSRYGLVNAAFDHFLNGDNAAALVAVEDAKNHAAKLSFGGETVDAVLELVAALAREGVDGRVYLNPVSDFYTLFAPQSSALADYSSVAVSFTVAAKRQTELNNRPR